MFIKTDIGKNFGKAIVDNLKEIFKKFDESRKVQ